MTRFLSIAVLLFASSTALAKPPAKPKAAPAPAAAAPATPGPPVAPAPDAQGRIPFATPSKQSRYGLVEVKADQPGVSINIDGKFLGIAPQTISNVPLGDYIVEGTFPDGRTATRPVSIMEGQIAEVMLTPIKVTTPNVAPQGTWRQRLRPATYAAAGVGAAGLVAGAVFGYLEMKKQDEYDNAPLNSPADQAHIDDLGDQGKRYAVLANISFGVAAAGIITAAVLGYRDMRATGETPQPAPVPLTLAPTIVPGGFGAGAILRF